VKVVDDGQDTSDPGGVFGSLRREIPSRGEIPVLAAIGFRCDRERFSMRPQRLARVAVQEVPGARAGVASKIESNRAP
jgi:hypothetical protein